ncbi:antibiotic biosynthesis monooxygenase family protein [Flavilitoribacter nigricans]|uniref:Antibiotic biosynthesis monooxygenase n=1 Tax=Flavilitoribacter nigricans (strain ATCC 23147 / DSM 23189 / NBRC 102662 / NCIMB 1420 / SS-2) TaxID=1122177 RepID=A0A2D0N8J1_FLAN2|nr:hypothetical protein [Flavilitoribacter nigricans]PHN04706.1 hypothetical protein CRP01_19515 [Flavilitoribacter nigricans DSM 23189 = NBRC 102662]
MIIVLVEHFLNNEGIHYFPEWIDRARPVLAPFEGYLNIRRMKDVENASRCVLMLEFAELGQLRSWAKSTEHNELVALLDPYVVQKRQSKVYSVSD